MYKYKNEGVLSTKKAFVVANDVNVATIEKYYDNLFQRILGTVSIGQIYNNYLIKDLNSADFVKVKTVPSEQEKEYKLEYHCSNNTYELYLNKYGLVSNEKVGTFQFGDDVFNVYSDMYKVTHIEKSDIKEEIAIWKNQGNSNVVKDSSKLFSENILLFIAILHAFSHNTLSLNKILMPMTLPLK